MFYIARAITSAVVTIPACIYLLQSGPDNGHGHGHDGEGHRQEENGEGHGEGEREAGETSDKPAPNSEPFDVIPDLRKDTSEDEEDRAAEQAEESGEEEGERGGEEKAEDQSGDSGSEGEDQQDTPETSDDEQPKNVAHETESGRNVEGVQFKGATSGGTKDHVQNDTRKHIPDAKGGNKKRIESAYGNRQGVAYDDNLEEDETGAKKDKVR